MDNISVNKLQKKTERMLDGENNIEKVREKKIDKGKEVKRKR